MWVTENSGNALAKEKLEWRQARDLHIRRGGSSFYTLPPGPLHVIVPWLDFWQPEMLDTELDPAISQQHWQELRQYPLTGLH